MNMANLISGIHHIAIKYNGPEQLKAALNFYHDLLGLPVLRSWGEGDRKVVMVDTGKGILELFASGGPLPDGVYSHLAFAVKDVDACVEAVRRAGYPITTEPKDVVIAAEEPYPARLAFCRGPGNEEIEFFCEK